MQPDQAVADQTSPAGVSTEPFRWGILLIILSGVFITTLDFFIVNVAVPSVQRDLNASDAAIELVVAGYALGLGSTLITAGRLGDLYGRRRMFVVGLSLFTLASIACGLATQPATLVTARIVQGVGGALLMPQVLAIVRTVYTGRQQAIALAAYSATLGLGGVFGQVLGGALIQWDAFGLGWRIVFLINVPVGMAAGLASLRIVPESRGGDTGLDLKGAVLATAGLAAVVFPLIEGREHGWPWWAWALLLTGLALLAAFARHQRRLSRTGGAPLVDMTLFRERGFTAGLAITLVYYSTMASFFLTFALYLQHGRGLSPLGAGLVAMVLGAGFFLGAALAPGVASRWNHQVLAIGAAAQAAGYVVLGLTVMRLDADSASSWLLPGLAVAGLGMGMVMTPLIDTVLSGIAHKHAAAAGGVLTTAVEVGGAFGVAVVGYVFFGSLAGSAKPTDVSRGMAASLVELTIVALAVCALTQLLPSARRR